MKNMFQDSSCKVFNRGRKNHTAHEQKEQAFSQFRQKNGKSHCCHSVNGAHRTIYKSSVNELVSSHRRHNHFRTPAHKRADEKEPEQLISRISHVSSLSLILIQLSAGESPAESCQLQQFPEIFDIIIRQLKLFIPVICGICIFHCTNLHSRCLSCFDPCRHIFKDQTVFW